MAEAYYSTQADIDVYSILRYFVHHASPEVADRFLTQIDLTTDLLLEHPHIGRRLQWDDPRAEDVRVWRVEGFESYLLFYRPVPEGIELIRVLHGARDLPEEFAGTDWEA